MSIELRMSEDLVNGALGRSRDDRFNKILCVRRRDVTSVGD
jgi:hypothetical protein